MKEPNLGDQLLRPEPPGQTSQTLSAQRPHVLSVQNQRSALRLLLRPSRMSLTTIRRRAIRSCAPSILVDPSELADKVTELPRHLGRDEGPEGRHHCLRPAVQHGVDELVVGPP